jgi:NCS2 family nucleobase:cation symporter-2
MIDFTAVQRAPMFTAPALLPFGISWPSIFTLAIMLVCFIVAVVETAIQSVAVARICGVSGDTTRARRAITADAFGSIVSALFGGLPLTSYSQNIGVITLTGVGSRAVVAGCGAILIALSFLPSISLGISLTPAPVIGGALLFMFGTIVILGIDLLGDLRKPRDRSIVTISLSLSLAVTFASHEQLSILPDIARALAGQGIVVGTIVAIVANIVLPGRAYIKDDVVEDRSRLGGSTEAG